ncbi:DUF6602 domain-containing protein [Nocardia cyriacigeorgica]|uniref:DUF6602 domain-containing protein n=1 Tax=Nocardia cyriacigeorgica TaxID=135487 RepID=UPI0011B0C0DC|nr:DUF6602 domain-containing protein [Nocardia cyriacigeorgica]MBF6322350.1 hypothetical protein [Nocardia cyriacigeorgica]
MIHEHHDWLVDVAAEMSREYEKARALAARASGVQHAGHKGEAAWANALHAWLPPQYEIGKRKYILLEDDSTGVNKSAETDLVIFQPSYPERLRARDEILVSGVAAAFSVKNSLDRSGISEAIKEAATVRRATRLRSNTVKDEILPPFLYGVLAHTHVWKRTESDPAGNVTKALAELDAEHSDNPREGLDLLCVADLGCWSRVTTIWKYPEPGTFQAQVFPYGGVCSGFVTDHPGSDVGENEAHVATNDTPKFPPFASLISILLNKLSYRDANVKPIADGLRLTSPEGDRDGQLRHWHLMNALSSYAREQLDNEPWAYDSVYM